MVPTPRRARPVSMRPNALANLDRGPIVKGPELFLSDTPRFKRFIPPPEPISTPAVPPMSALHAVEVQQLRAEISTLKSHVKSLSTTNKLLDTQLRLARTQAAQTKVREARKVDQGKKEEMGVVQKRELRMKAESTTLNDTSTGPITDSRSITYPGRLNRCIPAPTISSLSGMTSGKPLNALRSAKPLSKLASPRPSAKRLSSASAASRRSSGIPIRS